MSVGKVITLEEKRFADISLARAYAKQSPKFSFARMSAALAEIAIGFASDSGLHSQ